MFWYRTLVFSRKTCINSYIFSSSFFSFLILPLLFLQFEYSNPLTNVIYSPDIKTNTNKLLEWKIVTLYFLCFPWCWLRNYLHHLQKVSTIISGATRTMVRSKVERLKQEVFDAGWAYHHQLKISEVWSVPKKIIRHKTQKLIEQDDYSFNNDCGCAYRTRWFW